jgi:hypothetical protein
LYPTPFGQILEGVLGVVATMWRRASDARFTVAGA